MAILFEYTDAGDFGSIGDNKVRVTGGTSGAPADFDDFVTADRAGTGTTILDAGTPANNLALDTPVRPVEDKALIVKCIVANKTAQADFIFISGEDWRGAAQTESIDVTAGNGSYTSTKYWSEITTLDCSDNAAGGGTVWADGDLSVTQDIWGVIWDYGSTRHYQIDCNVDFGDTSTSTYFTSIKERVYFSDGMAWEVTANATVQLGSLVGSYGTDGSMWDCAPPANYFRVLDAGAGGVLLVYSSWIHVRSSCQMIVRVGTFTVKNSILSHEWSVHGTNWCRWQLTGTTTVSFDRVFISNAKNIVMDLVPSLFSDVHVHNSDQGFGCSESGVTVTGPLFTDVNNDIYLESVGQIIVVDPVNNLSNIYVGNPSRWCKEAYTCNINVSDKDGSALQNVVVDCEDTNTDAVWAAGTITTDASGDITEQLIIYKYYYNSAGDQVTTYSPHKFTLSKIGYETLVLESITVDGPINWHLELQDEVVYPAENDVENGVTYGDGGAEFTGNVELPAEADVEEAVSFGANGTEFTGDLELPAENDVEDGVSYGSGGIEFEGTFEAPIEGNVRLGIGYGANGMEYIGVMEPQLLPLVVAAELDGVLNLAITVEDVIDVSVEVL